MNSNKGGKRCKGRKRKECTHWAKGRTKGAKRKQKMAKRGHLGHALDKKGWKGGKNVGRIVSDRYDMVKWQRWVVRFPPW